MFENRAILTMALKLGTADQPGYLHHGDARCGRLFTFFYCHRRFTTGSLRFRPPTLTSFNKYPKVSNIDQRDTMPSRHTAAITAPFRHPSVTESPVALPPISREASVARSTNARFTASR